MLDEKIVEKSYRNKRIFQLENFLSKDKGYSKASLCVDRYAASELTEYLIYEGVDPAHTPLLNALHGAYLHGAYSIEFENKLFNANLKFAQSFSFCDPNEVYAGWCWPTDPECPDDAPEQGFPSLAR